MTTMPLSIVLLLFVLALTAYAAWIGAPWLPTPRRAIDAALDALSVGPSDTVVDLGAGDGRVLVAAARRGARAIGYELSPLFWALAWARTFRLGRLVSVRLADGFRADLQGATVLFAFLRPATMPRLAQAIEKGEWRKEKSVHVVSYAFLLPGRQPAQVLRPPGCAPVYVYRIG